MSPYDPCVWNIDVDHKQLIMIFHADDIMLVHAGSNIVKHASR